MRIFISGRSGFIAKNLISALASHHVIGTSSRDEDITNALIHFKPDVICHLAAESYDTQEMVKANILLTHAVLEYCRQAPVQKLLIFGSSSEYGRKDHPLTEKDALNPQSIYEGTKAAASLLAQSYAYTYNIPTVIVRPLSIYGPHEHSNKLMTRIFMGKITHLNEAVHDWTYIDDFVGAVCAIINHSSVCIFDIVNIGLGVQRSNQDVLQIARNILNKQIDVETRSTSMGVGTDSQMWVCDPTHLKTLYGFTPSITLEEGMRRHYEWLRNSLISPHT
jgi:nucleoside-diphosphate-sugar epimerase